MNPQQKALAIFVAGAVGGAGLTLLLLASTGLLAGWPFDRQPVTVPIASTAPPGPSLSSTPLTSPTPDPLVSILLLDFATGWRKTSAGPTHLDGELWVPEITTVVKNMSALEIERVWLRAMFFDSGGIITSEQSELVEHLPSGYAKGPVFLTGKAGYPGTSPVVHLRRATRQWRYELYQATTNTGPWTKIGAGLVDAPSESRPIVRR